MTLLMPSKSNITFVCNMQQDRFSIPDNSFRVGASIVLPFELKEAKVHLKSS